MYNEIALNTMKILDILIKILGPFLIVLATGIIIMVAYVFFTVSLPFLAGENLIVYSLHSAIASFLVINILFNYILCVITHPGNPKTAPEQLKTSISKRIALQEIDVSIPFLNHSTMPPSPFGFCRKCQIPKLPRSHHCHICNECILLMDHHCPWVNNCIGFYNYRYFWLFLFYLFLGCIYSSLTSFSPFLISLEKNPLRISANNKLFLTLSFVLCVSVGFTVGCLWFWHLYLLLTGQGTIEFYQNRHLRSKFRRRGKVYRHEYDLGKKRNFEQVFGCNSYHWIFSLLPSTRLPPSPLLPRSIREYSSKTKDIIDIV